MKPYEPEEKPKKRGVRADRSSYFHNTGLEDSQHGVSQSEIVEKAYFKAVEALVSGQEVRKSQ